MTEKQFEEAIHTYGDTIYRVACHAVREPSDAEDIIQTVLLKLYQYTGTFESEKHLKHWLLRVTVNESRRLLHSFWRRHTTPLEDWDRPVEDSPVNEVLDAVMALEPKYRLPIYLYYYENCSVREAAEILHTKESTIQTRLQRARAKLRAALTESETTEEGQPYVRPEIVP